MKQLHDEQFSIYGQSSKELKDAIVDAFGGIDQLLQCIWSSDIVIDDERLEQLEHIIGNPHIYNHQAAPTKHAITRIRKATETCAPNYKTITYEFIDDDMILRKLFNKKRAYRIKSMLTSNTMLIWLTSLLIANAFLSVSARLANKDGLFAFTFFFMWLLLIPSFMLFETGLLLCANIKALKMLSTEFIFLLKIFYLMQFVVGNAYYDYIYYGDKMSIVNVSTIGLLATLGLILTMIADALSISHRIKIFFTVYALGFFAGSMIDFRRTSFHRNTYYEQSNIVFAVFPSLFSFDPMNINAVDIAASAAPVLVAFTCKQLFLMIYKPDKAVTIRIKPCIVYRNREHNMWSLQKLKVAKFCLIIFFALRAILCCYSLVAGVGTALSFLYAYMLFALVMAITLMIIGSVKSLYATNVFILSIAAALSVDSFLSNTWRINGVFVWIFFFGLTAIYTLASIESTGFRKNNYVSPRDDTYDDSSNEDVEFSSDDQRKRDIDLDVVIGYNEESKPEMIEMNDVHDAGRWDNIDRQQSVESNEDNAVNVMMRGMSTHL